jgi:hypothetical protein
VHALGAAGFVASGLRTLGRTAEAGELLERAVDVSVRRLGPQHHVTSSLRDLLAHAGPRTPADAGHEELGASVARLLGRPEAPIEELRRELERVHSQRGDEDALTLQLTVRLGWSLIWKHGAAEAIEMVSAALPAIHRTVGRDHDLALSAMTTLGAALHAQGDARRARAVLEEAVEISRASNGPGHASTLRTVRALAEVKRTDLQSSGGGS